MTAAEILRDIRDRKFKPVYLLHGEEAYYIDRIAGEIESRLLTDAERSFNQTILYGKDTDVATVLNAVKRFPMMSDYQLVMIKEAQDLKWVKGSGDESRSGDPLLAYLEKPLLSTVLVFCYKYGKFDKRKKAYKSIVKSGVVFESPEIYDNKVPAWIEDFLRDKNYRIHARASALMAEYLGNDLSRIANELEKLMLNVPPAVEITTDHVENYIGISKEYNVFELQNAIAKLDPLKVNQIINYFAANPKSNPLVLVLGTLNTYFTRILRYHYSADRSPQGLARELGVNPYFIKDLELAGRNYSKAKIFSVISYLRECDTRSKGVDATGNTTDGELMKELLFKIIH